MKIYSCNFSGNAPKMEKMRKYDMGMLITTTTDISWAKSSIKPDRLEGMSLALDNGAFSNWKNNKPFDEFAFLQHLNLVIDRVWGQIEFVVCPDLIAKGGVESLDFSARWFERLQCDRMYLVMQSGHSPEVVQPYLDQYDFTGLFLGGDKQFKFDTLRDGWFQKLGADNSLKMHVGAIGNLHELRFCSDLNCIDSVDSTNYVRNDSFDTIEEFVRPTQGEMF